MQKLRYFFYIMVFTFLFSNCSSEYSLPIELGSDYWEGERPVIVAEFTVGSIGELTIQNTISPVSKSLPEPNYITDRKVFILRDNLMFDTMTYDVIKFKYISNKIIEGDHYYQLIFPDFKDSIISKTIFIPDEKIHLQKLNLIINDSLLSGEITFNLENFIGGTATIIAQFTGPELFRMKIYNSIQIKREPQFCLNTQEQVNISCLANKSIYLGITELYLNNIYTLNKSDSMKVFFEYTSQDLGYILNANSYKGNEFGTNNPFVSSFTNGYGVFGYRHKFHHSVPLLK